MTGYAPGVYDIPDPDGRAKEWTVEGVARCPGDCGLYFDIEATLTELENFIEVHDCARAKRNARYTL